MKTLVVSALLVTFPTATLAADCKRPQRVTKPCKGDLLPIALSAKAVKCLKTCQKECDAKAEHMSKTYQAKLDTLNGLLAVEKGKTAKLGALLDKALKEPPPEEPAIWEMNEFWGIVGFGMGVGMMTGFIFLTN